MKGVLRGRDVFVKPISDVSHAEDVRGVLEIVLDFLSKGGHMRIDGPVRHVHVLAPDLFQEVVARDDLAAPLEKEGEHSKFRISELKLDLALERRMLSNVEPDRPRLERLAILVALLRAP